MATIVRVRVEVEAFIDLSIAVVVQTVAHFHGSRMDGRVRIVAIALAGGEAVGIVVCAGHAEAVHAHVRRGAAALEGAVEETALGA